MQVGGVGEAEPAQRLDVGGIDRRARRRGELLGEALGASGCAPGPSKR